MFRSSATKVPPIHDVKRTGTPCWDRCQPARQERTYCRLSVVGRPPKSTACMNAVLSRHDGRCLAVRTTQGESLFHVNAAGVTCIGDEHRVCAADLEALGKPVPRHNLPIVPCVPVDGFAEPQQLATVGVTHPRKCTLTGKSRLRVVSGVESNLPGSLNPCRQDIGNLPNVAGDSLVPNRRADNGSVCDSSKCGFIILGAGT